MNADEPDTDSDLFRDAIGEVRPLARERHYTPPPKPSARPRMREQDEAEAVRDMLSDDFDPGTVDYGDYLFHALPGVKKSLLRQLRRGNLPIDGDLDLHGMIRREARQAVSEFLREARDHRARCVKIIHGKGNRSAGQGPVLKNMVNRWLVQRDDVLAFCSATPDDGDIGAVYVLLRRG